MELMCPAGSLEALEAAVQAGADAVYFGVGDYNARRNAKNISEEQLPQALAYCRLWGVRSYVTVNTLLSDRELPRVSQLLETLSREGADAAIVQDLGVLRLARAVAPDLPVHASTQVTVHNLAGALACKELGFSRVVLSRELPLEEIRYITQRSGIETEVFCHGALCMCYSGQCYLSAAIGGRSGNRGLCAQPCRLPYGFDGGPPKPWLSLKDLSLACHLQELEQAGVACVKIEGRMKRPEYVALTADIYKRAVAGKKPPSAEELEQLRAIFSRSGFTDGYFTGQTGETMFGARSEADAQVAQPLYAQARKLYESRTEKPRVPLELAFSAQPDQPLTLTARDGEGHEAQAQGGPAEAALSRATSAEEIEKNLRKTGGTVFAPSRVSVRLAPGLRVSAAQVNGLRRQCLDQLAQARQTPPARRARVMPPLPRQKGPQAPPALIFQALKWDQLSPELLEERPQFVYLPLAECRRNLDRCAAWMEQGIEVVPALPRIWFDSQQDQAMEELNQCRGAGMKTVLCPNLGWIALLQGQGFTLRGDFGLNVMNSLAIEQLSRMGLTSAALSFEMNFAQMRDLGKALPLEALVYGRLPLMIFENCAIRRGAGRCACREGKHFLSDKTGRRFPLVPEPHCRNTLYNSEPLCLSDKTDDYAGLGLTWARFSFTTESAEECAHILRRYRQGQACPSPYTRGLYYRGVK